MIVLLPFNNTICCITKPHEKLYGSRGEVIIVIFQSFDHNFADRRVLCSWQCFCASVDFGIWWLTSTGLLVTATSCPSLSRNHERSCFQWLCLLILGDGGSGTVKLIVCLFYVLLWNTFLSLGIFTVFSLPLWMTVDQSLCGKYVVLWLEWLMLLLLLSPKAHWFRTRILRFEVFTQIADCLYYKAHLRNMFDRICNAINPAVMLQKIFCLYRYMLPDQILDQSHAVRIW